LPRKKGGGTFPQRTGDFFAIIGKKREAAHIVKKKKRGEKKTRHFPRRTTTIDLGKGKRRVGTVLERKRGGVPIPVLNEPPVLRQAKGSFLGKRRGGPRCLASGPSLCSGKGKGGPAQPMGRKLEHSGREEKDEST